VVKHRLKLKEEFEANKKLDIYESKQMQLGGNSRRRSASANSGGHRDQEFVEGDE